MIAVTFLLGFVAGWLIGWATDVLPRFAATPVLTAHTTNIPDWPASIQLGFKWSAVRVPAQRAWLVLRAAIELVCGLVFAALWQRYGLAAEGVAYAALIAFLLLIALIDLRYRLILNVLIYPALIVIIGVHALLVPEHALNILLGGVMAGSIFFLTAWLKPGELGGGDVKLATFIGFAFGFPNVLWALLLGTGSAGVLIAFWLLTRRARLQTRIPYAPFLCLGAILAIIISPPFVA